ncbi:MAG: LURP-one-related/scramblase family protein [Planctomycetota bacterium]|jgi:uncharacterized protein YxjI
MRYQLRQKLLALGDDFTIRDENDRPVYYVDGKVLALGKKLSFQDAARNELLFIKQKLLSWRSTYHLLRQGELVAVVQRHLWALFRTRLTIHVIGQPDLSVQGDLLEHDYAFSRDGATVAQVSKAWFTLADKYGVEVGEGQDPVLILACVVVIDLMCQSRRHS